MVHNAAVPATKSRLETEVFNADTLQPFPKPVQITHAACLQWQ
jgi:hypothetical protein